MFTFSVFFTALHAARSDLVLPRTLLSLQLPCTFDTLITIQTSWMRVKLFPVRICSWDVKTEIDTYKLMELNDEKDLILLVKLKVLVHPRIRVLISLPYIYFYRNWLGKILVFSLIWFKKSRTKKSLIPIKILNFNFFFLLLFL